MDYQEALDLTKKTVDAGEMIKDIESYSYFYTVKSALEKQIPQKPERSGKFGVCPSCSRLIERYEQKHGNIEIPHCKWCGQAIDWSDE